jgi:hypothetical protein
MSVTVVSRDGSSSGFTRQVLCWIWNLDAIWLTPLNFGSIWDHDLFRAPFGGGQVEIRGGNDHSDLEPCMPPCCPRPPPLSLLVFVSFLAFLFSFYDFFSFLEELWCKICSIDQ